ncbi:amidohydrolase family protein [Bacteroides caecigallinarum]|uniref:hypothetical protein n=1 Tax=Bacteroides caecigallinarum TaxID=1411144 RepID=UPI001F2F6DBC|nr:hypothetical protein [Bacteroides caecigallinarum]MCF2582940.1 hypothetical protein [Bacteroides caecigallinarum]
MDLLRSTIEAVFYHYPLPVLAELINNKRGDEDMLSVVAEIIKWKLKEFSSTEIFTLKNIMQNEWMTDVKRNFLPGGTPAYLRAFLVLNRFTDSVLCTSHDRQPIVKFDNLLRWHETSLLVSEDLLTTAFLAEKDLKDNYERKEFVWPDVIGHDNFKLNSILDEGLSDTHSHINAAIAVFDFNWISLMNYPNMIAGKNDRDEGFTDKGSFQSYDPVARNSVYNNKSLRWWVQLAAIIRAGLTEILLCNSGNNSKLSEDFLNMLRMPCIAGMLANAKYSINNMRMSALKTESGYAFDYAIRHLRAMDLPESTVTNVYMLHHGERELMYSFFYNYWGNSKGMRQLAPWFYLYCLIKNKLRREFVQTNSLVGFDNFNDYQKHKSIFIPELNDSGRKIFNEIIYRYAVQSAIGGNSRYNLEARMTPGAIKRFMGYDCSHSIFGNVEVYQNNPDSRLTIVAHFIKKKENVAVPGRLRNHKTIKELWKQVKLLSECWEKGNTARLKNKTYFVGIDAASSEFNCRPEVFAPIFRYARFKGIDNQTFHAGEDFYDISDGLRTIDETVFYMHFRLGCRLGHALALGTDAERYYRERHNTIIIPQQILLDNLVWLKYRAMEHNISLSAKVQLLIEEKSVQLMQRLRYPETHLYTYWQSMLHRGDSHDDSRNLPDEVKYTMSGIDMTPNDNTRKCLEHYLYNTECRTEGDKAVTIQLPEAYADDIVRLQSCMLDELAEKGIAIECNPTSNLKIGRFSHYIEHPIFAFHPIESDRRNGLCVSINTDDRGVFGTSLRNEYSLIAIAMYKQKDSDGNRRWTDVQIEEYIKRIAHYGNLTRFRR